MELLSPAGTLEKLRVAYRYGADAAYVGIRGFSLRSSADTILAGVDADHEARIAEILRLKHLDGRPRKLYGALNLFAHEGDLRALPEVLETVRHYPLDALIIADIGLLEPVRSVLPEIDLHLSTQANCTNSNAAKLYHRIGFSRIVTARELALDDIRAIRDAVPELEIETFVHGAMCMSYSGRCFLSTAMIGRSANHGDCAHSCRWNYAITEEKRPGEYYPIEEDGNFSTILSSRDLMLYDRIAELADAGITAVKIEGRMKSALYTAVTAGAYRYQIDTTGRRTKDSGEGTPPTPEAHTRWRDLLCSLSHRDYTAGFLFDDESVHKAADGASPGTFRLMGILRGPDTSDQNTDKQPAADRRRVLEAKNAIYRTQPLLLLTPTGTLYPIDEPELYDAAGLSTERVVQGKPGTIRLPQSVYAEPMEDAILVSARAPLSGER